jgi:hypothetical protein
MNLNDALHTTWPTDPTAHETKEPSFSVWCFFEDAIAQVFTGPSSANQEASSNGHQWCQMVCKR